MLLCAYRVEKPKWERRTIEMNRKPRILNNLHVSAVIVIVCTLLAMSIIEYPNISASASLPPMTLTIVGWDGRLLTLHETEIDALTSYRAYGGYRNQLGNIRGLGFYTGVPFTTLCDLVGGILPGDTVRVTASDDYYFDFTYSEVYGDFVTWDPATGQEVPHSQPLVPIFAYYYKDLPLTDGPLKTAVVGPDGLVTRSVYWVKYAVKMEIISGPVAHASVDIAPYALNIRGSGEWITAYIQPDEGYDAMDVNASSILLNSTLSPILDPKYSFVTDPNEYLVDPNGDGIIERMVKFNRTEVELLISNNLATVHGYVTMTITGQFDDGTRFKGADIIFVFCGGAGGGGGGRRR
jgi:hypothetical protein